MIKSNDNETASISVKRIIGICLIFLFITSICVFAANKQVKNVKIVLSNGCEMDVVTSKTKVSDILEEKHIILLPEEKVTPDEDQTVGANGEIIITERTAQEEVAEAVTTSSEENIVSLDLETVSQAYNPITEKIVVETVEIPYETITKKATNSSKTREQVIQKGKNGKKEVTYRVKYQNNKEIERKEISSKVIEEPVNKVVQVKAKETSRGSGAIRATGTKAQYQAYAKSRCKAYGWSDYDFDCLVSLWNKESGWNPTAHNSRSGAHGIPQALPASKMAKYGSDYMTDYKTQIDWGLNYIKGRYGSPSKAWSHSKSKGWY